MMVKTHLKAGDQQAPTFAHFMRSLRADSFRRSRLWLMLAAALLAAWLVWLFLARVTLHEVTQAAHLEANPAAMASLVRGRVVASALAIGKRVRAGQVLIELDAHAQRLQLKQQHARLTGIVPQLAALADEITAEKRAIGNDRQAGRAAVDEARARVEEAEEAAHYAADQAARLANLRANNAIAEIEILRAESEARSLEAAASSLAFTVSRLRREQRTEETERRLRIERLERERARLQARRTVSAAAIRRLKNEIDKRRIRAPINGRLAGVADLRVGAVVRAGEKLATVLPPGALAIAADYPPSTLGRIRRGQSARMRLDAFPWTQYGSLAATVRNVASEVRTGKIRVELAVHPDPASRILLQHGLPGTVEVEVERVSPAVLALRAARLLTHPAVEVQSQETLHK